MRSHDDPEVCAAAARECDLADNGPRLRLDVQTVFPVEAAEKDNEEFFRKILSLRNSTPALAKGTCDYLKCNTGHPSVLALYREYNGAFCIPVFNFSEQPSPCRLRVRGPLPVCEGPLRNAADGTEIRADLTSRLMEEEGIELDLPANGLLILQF